MRRCRCHLGQLVGLSLPPSGQLGQGGTGGLLATLPALLTQPAASGRPYFQMRLSFSRIGLGLSLAFALSACQTVSVQDGDMFRRTQAASPVALVETMQPLAAPRQVEAIGFHGQDGVQLGGLFLRHPQAKATVVYFQGGGNHITKDARWLAKLAADLPVHLMVWDYRGMGLSAGKGGTAHMLGDALAAVAQARSSGGADLPLVYWGYSMGTLISAHLSQQLPPDALILEGTLTNAQDWAENSVPWWAKPFVSVELGDGVRAFDNREALRQHQRPTLLLVGGRDKTTPPRFSQAVVQQMQHRQCVTLSEAPESGHGGIHFQAESRAALQRFIQQVKPGMGC
jgi:pimeloyl-ACP methyl ester carboxylesterase